jgi:hypothetical protein
MVLTAQEYIETKLKKFGVDFEQIEIKALFIEQSITPTLSIEDSASLKSVQKCLVSMLSEMLLMPNITEGGYSVSWNLDGLKAYLNELNTKLGNDVIGEAIVTNASEKW